MEQMPLPRFYGEPRYYHRFIRDFNELVRPNLEEREAAFTFRQCLGKEVETVLGSGDYNLDEMITRLDGKYGDLSKMIDSVIGEIQRYRKIDYDDYKRLIEFVNILERAFHDLKSVKMEQEINNSNVVSIIERKLPKNVALNRYRQIHSSESKVEITNKFPFLLEFLKNERNAIEYGMAELRISSEKRYCSIHHTDKNNQLSCLLHTSEAHTTSDCRLYRNLKSK